MRDCVPEVTSPVSSKILAVRLGPTRQKFKGENPLEKLDGSRENSTNTDKWKPPKSGWAYGSTASIIGLSLSLAVAFS